MANESKKWDAAREGFTLADLEEARSLLLDYGNHADESRVARRIAKVKAAVRTGCKSCDDAGLDCSEPTYAQLREQYEALRAACALDQLEDRASLDSRKLVCGCGVVLRSGKCPNVDCPRS